MYVAASIPTEPVPAPTSINTEFSESLSFATETALTSCFVMGTSPLIKSLSAICPIISPF